MNYSFLQISHLRWRKLFILGTVLVCDSFIHESLYSTTSKFLHRSRACTHVIDVNLTRVACYSEFRVLGPRCIKEEVQWQALSVATRSPWHHGIMISIFYGMVADLGYLYMLIIIHYCLLLVHFQLNQPFWRLLTPKFKIN